MSSRRGLHLWWCLAAVALVACTSTATGPTSPGSEPTSGGEQPSSPTHAASVRPNILVILTDDQRIGTLGVMPATRRVFARGGTTFTNGFTTTPLCCPSRAGILTGRYAHNTGVHTNEDALKLDQGTTVERHLHDAGYQTGIVGKFLNSWPLERNPPFFDRWALFNSGYFRTGWNVQGHERTVSEYSTDFISDESVKILNGFERHDRVPWFLYVATSAPHDPWIPEPRHAHDRVPPFAKNPAMRETDLSDKPPWVRNAQRVPNELIAKNRADQLETLRSVDDLVGRLFRTLDRLGENKDTLAVFMSDNGFLWGDHGLTGGRRMGIATGPAENSGKRYPYTQSIEVPFLMRWPGHVRSGATDSRIVANIDLAPTFLQAAGVTLDHGARMDGHSLLGPGGRSDLLLEYFHDPLIPALPSWTSIRTKEVQYVEYRGRDGRVIFREYYDLRRDRFQLDNLLHDSDPSNDPDVSTLASDIRQGARCSGVSGSGACP